MSWIMVASQESVNELLTRIDWSNAFVREAYLVSPSYIMPVNRATVHADAAPSMKFLITSPYQNQSALELLFTGLETLSIWFGGRELSPSAMWSEREISWTFHMHIQAPILAQSLYYRFLDETSWGDKLRYGWEPMFDDSGQVVIK